jgi:hypothetical protein
MTGDGVDIIAPSCDLGDVIACHRRGYSLAILGDVIAVIAVIPR